MTAVNAVQVVTLPAMTAQMYDYQQYKTGERLEGFYLNLVLLLQAK